MIYLCKRKVDVHLHMLVLKRQLGGREPGGVESYRLENSSDVIC